MAMNDVETAALIVGGHTIGKTHGAAPADNVGPPEPEAAPLEQQGLGVEEHPRHRCRRRRDHQWPGRYLDATPTTWDNSFLETLYGFEWEKTKSPAGGHGSGSPKDGAGADLVPDAHDSSKRHAPTMLTTDLSLRLDPIYGPITRRWLDHPEELSEEFAKAWYKLLHRDMGPVSRYLGSRIPEPQLWQDPVPAVDHELVGADDVAALEEKVLASGLTIPQLIATAWRRRRVSAAPTSAAARTVPGCGWPPRRRTGRSTNPPSSPRYSRNSNRSARLESGGKKISLADLIVLAGGAAVRKAAKNAGLDLEVPFTPPGRTDATQELTDVDSFAVLEPPADGFRNYLPAGEKRQPEKLLVERANLLSLTASELTVLVGGLRALNANHNGTPHGVLTDRPEALTNDYFVNLLDMGTEWKTSESTENVYEGRDRASGDVKWTATAVDLIFGANSVLRGLAEVYAADDAQAKFADDFVAAWTKVMNLDRFDVKKK